MSDRLHQLDDYVSGAMSDADAARFEEKLFEEPDAPEVVWLDAAARLAAHIHKSGTYQIGITRAAAEEYLRSGRKIAFVDIGRGGPGTFLRVSRSAEQVITRVEVDFGDAERIDTEIEIAPHGVVKTIRDVPVDREEGAIYAFCEASLFVKALGANATTRIIGYRGNERRELAVIQSTGEMID